MPKILLFDSYDSFTYNLKDYLEQQGANVVVVKNDQLPLKEIIQFLPDGIVFSPGPHKPSDAGNLMEVLDYFYNKIPVLGVCLGHQAIGEYFGMKLIKAKKPMHGKLSEIRLKDDLIFKEMPSFIQVCRYHSLVLEREDNEAIEVIAVTNDEEIMAIKHKHLPIWGVQYHPEAILSQFGHRLIGNWLNVVTLQKR